MRPTSLFDITHWIHEHYPTPESATGQCVEATLRLCAAFPDLRRARGHVVYPGCRRIEGDAHWWCVDSAGNIIDPVAHQLLAMVVGGIAGLVAIIGLSILLYRRLADPRIRLNSRKLDIVVAIMLWLQLALGLLTVPLSAFHMDGVLFETLTSYVKGIVALDGGAAVLMIEAPLPYKLHVLLGFTLFLI